MTLNKPVKIKKIKINNKTTPKLKEKLIFKGKFA